ncbi:fasciclin domain-containing protein [Flavobacterium chuncheonense]|uniref:Fasciclin domain-containing protein n=1 Tax=Flavobacterium chuncheonense TaxID=2026653 RepID=A0ABW5YPD9_9FLAO
MKFNAKLMKLMLWMVIPFTLLSCSDDDTINVPENNSITAIASRTPQFSILVDALVKAGLAETLNQNGSYTVFAPTNSAFTDFLNDKGFNSLNDVPVDALKEILLNHVVSGTNLSSNLTTGYVKTLGKGSASTTNTLSMFINTNSGVVLNGISTVTTADILADNGVIHEVNTVIDLPTIVTHALANPNFSTLTSILSQQGLVPTLAGESGSPFTVFAPDNNAFMTFEMENPGTLASLTSNQVTSVLTYHVVGGANVVSTGIPTTPITTLETGTFTINGTVITDESNRETNIIAVDIQASNGIIHVLDNILLPNL